MNTLPATLLEISCKIILSYKDVVKSIIVLDANFWRKY